MSDTATVETAEVEASKPAKKAKTPTPCLCRAYAVERKNDEGETERLVTGCNTDTSAKFAPGHDAKLKSLLIGAGANGHTVIKTTDEGELELSAMDAANEYGFASTVEKGIAKAAEKVAAKAEREAKKAAKLEASKATPGPAHAKVGRKVYQGEVLADGLTFQYEVTTGKGDEAVTEVKTANRFKVVEAPAEVEPQADEDDNSDADA